jgi:hypothetical protein
VLGLFLFKIVIEKKKDIWIEGGKERKGGRGKKKGMFKSCFLDPPFLQNISSRFFLVP